MMLYQHQYNVISKHVMAMHQLQYDVSSTIFHDILHRHQYDVVSKYVMTLHQHLYDDVSKYFIALHPSRYAVVSAICCWLYLVVLLFYVHGKHLRSCRDGQLT